MLTPLEHYPDLAKTIGLPDIYFKREDLNPYGSHKGRSIPFMIDYYYEKGNRHFAISSSGNAALAAIIHTNKINTGNAQPIDLDIFVGNHIAPHKLEKLKLASQSLDNSVSAKVGINDSHVRILIKERPLQALTQAVEEGSRSLRQSTDDQALIGYETLAEELTQTKNIGAVVIGTSSGTTAQALAEYFLKNKLPIQIHLVQTSSCHPMSDAFETFDGSDDRSDADAIVDQTAYRKTKLIPLIKKTGGHGWIASNDDIYSAQELVKKHTGLEISTNSALSVVGAMQIAYRGFEVKGAVVCMICGK
ncbi:MAG: PLP-dependent lyase/thiolase [Candidatus Paceibacterota bacterium]|jgi:threonine dehydratase